MILCLISRSENRQSPGAIGSWLTPLRNFNWVGDVRQPLLYLKVSNVYGFNENKVPVEQLELRMYPDAEQLDWLRLLLAPCPMIQTGRAIPSDSPLLKTGTTGPRGAQRF
jgi:hypothetical protein